MCHLCAVCVLVIFGLCFGGGWSDEYKLNKVGDDVCVIIVGGGVVDDGC